MTDEKMKRKMRDCLLEELDIFFEEAVKANGKDYFQKLEAAEQGVLDFFAYSAAWTQQYAPAVSWDDLRGHKQIN